MRMRQFLMSSSQFNYSRCSANCHTLQTRFFTSLKAMFHSNMRPRMAILLTFLLAGLFANSAHSSPTQSNRGTTSSSFASSSIRTQQCREGCFEKFATKEILCQQSAECLTCWDECAKPPPPKINKSIRETWALHTVSMLQQDSLVLVDVAWAPLTTPNQCLVTWEVSGGGLMGNLLTESFNVQLSLWPDTKYRVQVTCKNKLTGTMSRSLPLTIDTTDAVNAQERSHHQHQSQKQTTTTLLPSTDPKLNTDLNKFDLTGNSIIDSSVADLSVERDTGVAPAVVASGSSLPYDDQSAETINQHTNFIFNWHAKNSDISAIEPLHKPDLDILTIAALTELQKPLMFGVIAGTLLLAFILLLYFCMARQHRIPSDKAALIVDDVHSVVVSFPPTEVSSGISYSGGGGTGATQEEVCRSTAICSRNALKV